MRSHQIKSFSRRCLPNLTQSAPVLKAQKAISLLRVLSNVNHAPEPATLAGREAATTKRETKTVLPMIAPQQTKSQAACLDWKAGTFIGRVQARFIFASSSLCW